MKQIEVKYSPCDKSLGKQALQVVLQAVDYEINGEAVLTPEYIVRLATSHGQMFANIMYAYFDYDFVKLAHFEADLFEYQMYRDKSTAEYFALVTEFLTISDCIVGSNVMLRILEDADLLDLYAITFAMEFDFMVNGTIRVEVAA